MSQRIATSLAGRLIGFVLLFIGSGRLSRDLRTTLERIEAVGPSPVRD